MNPVRVPRTGRTNSLLAAPLNGALLSSGLLATILLSGGPVQLESATGAQLGVAKQSVSLRDRLLAGLQARLPAEIAFVDAVVAKVHTGQLPQRLVDQTFFWARQRAWDGRYGRPRRPIIFFQPAMKARARRLNVEL